jgi:hypothetical protein
LLIRCHYFEMWPERLLSLFGRMQKLFKVEVRKDRVENGDFEVVELCGELTRVLPIRGNDWVSEGLVTEVG